MPRPGQRRDRSPPRLASPDGKPAPGRGDWPACRVTALARIRAVLNRGRRRLGGQSASQQLRGDVLKSGSAHVDDKGAVRISVGRPIDLRAAVVRTMAGDQTHIVRQAAMRQRNAGIRSATRGGGNAWNDLKADAVPSEVLASSLPRPKMNGSPPFSRTTCRPARPASAAARWSRTGSDGDSRRACRRRCAACQSESGRKLVTDQPVIDHNIGGADQAQRFDRQQVRVPGPAPTR